MAKNFRLLQARLPVDVRERSQQEAMKLVRKMRMWRVAGYATVALGVIAAVLVTWLMIALLMLL